MNLLSRQLSPRREHPTGSNMTLVMPSDITRSSHMMVATASKTHRLPALDFTKGALVLFMVLYHWLNYFVSTEGDFYRYLRFLTPSFIFIIEHSHAQFGAAFCRT